MGVWSGTQTKEDQGFPGLLSPLEKNQLKMVSFNIMLLAWLCWPRCGMNLYLCAHGISLLTRDLTQSALACLV